jgi:FlaA1/EpsC-like NDP-sugar epimerase
MNLISILINRFYLKLDRATKKWIFRFIDIFCFAVSIYTAFIMRFDFFEAWVQLQSYKVQMALIIPLKFIFFWIAGIYRPVLRYAGLEFLSNVFIGVVGSTGLLALSGLMLVIEPLPRSILVLDATLTLILVVSVRLIVRWAVYYAVNQAERDTVQEKVIIYGAGEIGIQLAQALSNENHYKVVGFVDDNSQLTNQLIHGIKVYTPEKLPGLIKKHHIDSLLLAIVSAKKQEKMKIVEGLKHLGVQIKTIPRISDIISGKVSIADLRDIDIADLLGREEVKPDLQLLSKNISNKVVLITGAGGSIGSELCRQILQQQPKRLVLYEMNEFALYNIDTELHDNNPEVEIVACLGSVLNSQHFEKKLNEYKVETIYHTAAYKHVPLLESNISEGIINNVKGTLASVQAAVNCNVKTFVYISTDKAVRPTSVMGATKRAAELIVQAFASKKNINTRFVMVRFGNVLDSTGSVVPRFRFQLSQRMNLTITHEDVKRYFMSIPEAARLVIQAGALGLGGDVFLLDMGEQVRIYDLAKQMIELSGLTLDKDINIEITGLRPGEKLFEELLINDKNSTPTSHPKIFSAKEDFIPWNELSPRLETLFQLAEVSSINDILIELKGIVPEFNHSFFNNTIDIGIKS